MILISVENSSVLGGKQTVNQILQDMEKLFLNKKGLFYYKKSRSG